MSQNHPTVPPRPQHIATIRWCSCGYDRLRPKASGVFFVCPRAREHIREEKMLSRNEQNQRVGLRIFYFLFIYFCYLFIYLFLWAWSTASGEWLRIQVYCRGKTLTLLKTCIEQTNLELTATFLPRLPERNALKAHVLRLWSSAAGDLSISKSAVGVDFCMVLSPWLLVMTKYTEAITLSQFSNLQEEGNESYLCDRRRSPPNVKEWDIPPQRTVDIKSYYLVETVFLCLTVDICNRDINR